MKKLLLFLLTIAFSASLFAQSEADFGDAPDDSAKWWGGYGLFPTLDANQGPKHFRADETTFWLEKPDTYDGTNTTDLEDDALIVDRDNDDGQPFIFILLIGIPAPSQITVPIATNSAHNPSQDIYVNVAIDVDNDLDFDDDPDPNWVVQNKIVHCPADTTLGFSFGPFGFGSDLLLLPVWVRVTLTTGPVPSPWEGKRSGSGWTLGETEDWWFGAGGRGRNGRKGKNPPDSLPPDSIPPPPPPGGGPEPEKCVQLVYPKIVYIQCEEEKCIWVGVKDCGSKPVTNISLGFSFTAGEPLSEGPSVVGNPVKLGNTTWFKVCATGWPCDGSEQRRAWYKINVDYDPDGLFVRKQFDFTIASKQMPFDSTWNQRVAAEAVDSTGFAPWFIHNGQQFSVDLKTWQGQFPGGGDWLANGQPQLVPQTLFDWADFNESDRDGNNSATYTFNTNANLGRDDVGLHYLELEVSSTDPSDGFAPWTWRIPIYVSYDTFAPEIEEGFGAGYNLNVGDNEFMQKTLSASDDDLTLGQRDTTFYDWYLWDTDSSKFYDDPTGLSFLNNGDGTADFRWAPGEEDIGNYDLVGLCWDYYGSLDSTESTVSVFNMVPDFSGKYLVGYAPHTVTFTDKSTIENTDPTYEWNFDDGNYSSEHNPVNTYDNSGTYTVHLSLENDTHEIEELKNFYVVINDLDFQVDTTEGGAPLTVQFENLSSTEIPASYASSTATTVEFDWNWDFGDGMRSHEENPQHTYTAGGVYDVKLQGIIYIENAESALESGTVTSEWLAKESYITVQGELNADFEVDETEGYAPLTIQFTNLSTGNPESYNWSFGDGGSSDEEEPSYTYEEPGIYTVQLTINRGDESDTETKSSLITVKEPLVAAFSADPTFGEAPLEVTFTDESTGGTAPTAWHWDFGDGNDMDDERNPTHTYESAGEYDVLLVVQNSEEIDSLLKESYITVSPSGDSLVADFSAEPTSGEKPLTVQFADLSAGEPTSWLWSFGDGGESDAPEPEYTYNNAGTFTVTLEVSDGEETDAETKEDYIIVTTSGSVGDASKYLSQFLGYPNPTAGAVTFKFALKENATVTLKLYNVFGELTKTIIDNSYRARGIYLESWDGLDKFGEPVSQGVYYYELTIKSGGDVVKQTKEMIIIR